MFNDKELLTAVALFLVAVFIFWASQQKPPYSANVVMPTNSVVVPK